MCRPEKRSPSLDLEDVERSSLMASEQNKSDMNLSDSPSAKKAEAGGGGSISKMGLRVLLLLAVQNCAKNLVMRAAVGGGAKFLYSAAVIGTEGTKCACSVAFVLCTGGSPASIVAYLKAEWRKFALLAVPAGIYNFQQTLEYIALRNLNAALFSVLVQTKLLTTAIFSASLMGKKLRKAQVISLALLTTGVMLAQLSKDGGKRGDAGEDTGENRLHGVAATLGIAMSSGFAAVYTEKVIKAQRPAGGAAPPGAASSAGGANGGAPVQGGLAYTQIQLALTSLVIEGAWAALTDSANILEHGLWYGFDYKAMISVANSAMGGLTVAAVLKYADAVLKGYATAVSVLLTGVMSMLLFGTSLNVEYCLGMVNVLAAVILYNAKNLDANAW